MHSIAAATTARTTPAEATATRTRPSQNRCAPRHDDEGARGTEAPQRRGNPLVSAMMSALGALMPPSQAAASDRTDAPRSDALKNSVAAFAHELFDALRSSGDRGWAFGHGHHRHHGEGRRYDDLAQRLDRLAGQVDTPAAAALTGSTTTISASLSTASFSASVDGDSASAELSVTTLQIDITQQTTTAAVAAGSSAESPLQSAFRQLFDALQPAGSASSGSAGSLSGFLRQLADALRNGSGADDHTMAPATGGLLSLAA